MSNTTSGITCPDGYDHRGEMHFYPDKCINQDLVLLASCFLISAQISLFCFSNYTIFVRNRWWWRPTFWVTTPGDTTPKFRVKIDNHMLLAAVQLLTPPINLFVISGCAVEIHYRISLADRNPFVNTMFFLGEGVFHVQISIMMYLLSKIFVAMVSVPVQQQIRKTAHRFAIFCCGFAVIMFIRTLLVFVIPIYYPEFPLATVWWLTMAAYTTVIVATFGAFGWTVVWFMVKESETMRTMQGNAEKQAETVKKIKKLALINLFIMSLAIATDLISFIQLYVLDNSEPYLQYVFPYCSGSAISTIGLYTLTWQTKKSASDCFADDKE